MLCLEDTGDDQITPPDDPGVDSDDTIIFETDVFDEPGK